MEYDLRSIDNKSDIIFDFDGTIADSEWVWIWLLNEYADEFWYNAITKDDLNALKSMNKTQAMKYLHMWPIDALRVYSMREDYCLDHLNQISIFDWIPELIDILLWHWKKLHIMSSNVSKVITDVLIRENLYEYFQTITPVPVYMPYWKAGSLWYFMYWHNLKSKNVLYIWDEIRDVIACNKRRNSIECNGVSHWYNYPEALIEHWMSRIIY